MLPTAWTLHYNYLSCLVQLLVFLGVNCLFSSAWFCVTIPTSATTSIISPRTFHVVIRMHLVIYHDLKTSLWWPFSSWTGFSFGPVHDCYPGNSLCHRSGDSLHLLLGLVPPLSGSHVFLFHAFCPHFDGTPFPREGACEVNSLRNFLPENIFIFPLHLFG